MTLRDIAFHLEPTLGTELSHETISNVTDAVCEAVLAWQQRPLDALCPVIYLDAIVVKVRDAHVRNKATHIAVGVEVDGVKHVLGIWLQQTEGAKFWAGVRRSGQPRCPRRGNCVLRRPCRGCPRPSRRPGPKPPCRPHPLTMGGPGWSRRSPAPPGARPVQAASPSGPHADSIEAAAGAAHSFVYRGRPAERAGDIAAAEQEAEAAQRGL